MISDLNRRILITFFLLFMSRALSYIPISGVNFIALIQLIETNPSYLGVEGSTRATLGALGIVPYLAASTIIVLIFYFRKFRHDFDDHDTPVEFYTFILTGIISLLQGYGIAVFLENLVLDNGILAVPDPGWGFRLLTMFSMTAGTYLTVWLLTMITRNGIGNGICLFILVNLLLLVINNWWRIPEKIESNGSDVLMTLIVFLLLTIIIVAVTMMLMHARWQVPLRGNDEHPKFSLHINTIGTAGFHVGEGVTYIVSTLLYLSFVSTDIDDIHSPLHWIIFSVFTFIATYWLTALAYSPRGLKNTLDKFNKTSRSTAVSLENETFDRKLAIVTLPLAAGIPVIYIVYILFSLHALQYSVFGLPPITFFVITAIGLDIYRQYKQHRQMAATESDSDDELICENCKHTAGEEDIFCNYCGVSFAEKAHCEEHVDVEAEAICIICQKRLCSDCCFESSKRFVCEAHEGVELLHNWAVVATARTQLEAELCKQRLIDIPALVHSNTVGPVYGTLGLFESNPVTPFFVYRELGGGGIRVMVPIREWLKAQKFVEEWS